MVVFSGCMGVLMNLVSSMYLEGQERRMRMIEITKYMQWRVLPRGLKMNIRRYVAFLWDHCNEKLRETEVSLMEEISPTLRMSLSVHIFGSVLMRAPFLSWMHEYPLAVKKLAVRSISSFRDRNDVLFSYGEMVRTIYMLVNGWVTLSLGSIFDDANTDINPRLQLPPAGWFSDVVVGTR